MPVNVDQILQEVQRDMEARLQQAQQDLARVGTEIQGVAQGLPDDLVGQMLNKARADIEASIKTLNAAGTELETVFFRLRS